MKIIFLDVDGVLNNQYSKSRCGSYIGIDRDKVKRLRKIKEATGAQIILSSTWRLGINNQDQRLENHGKYLKKKLSQEKLFCISTTPVINNGNSRGTEIRKWFEINDDLNIEGWLVLDDEYFGDFDDEIKQHWLRTEYYDRDGGLQDEHIQKAIDILNNQFDS